ncbi:MAG TPA: ribose 5-phosphate isomerase B [Chitinophagales bacterium]|nr:ribose 5-phosphate isomerase B [Bacteroidota bacterium]HNJ61264.1 ribose 5-phosphate isomerase B [Chitinophagales bacterium]
MNFPSKIVIGSDHAGFEYKTEIIEFLRKINISIIDVGTNSEASCDYPDYAHALAEKIENKEAEMGILLCGSANGVAMAANKHQAIRAALCWENEIASLARLHNDANVLCLPARYVSIESAFEMVNTFFTTDFEGGRHQKRVDKI